MTTITKRAVYHSGSLSLDTPIDLPEDTLVEVEITIPRPNLPGLHPCTAHFQSSRR